MTGLSVPFFCNQYRKPIVLLSRNLLITEGSIYAMEKGKRARRCIETLRPFYDRYRLAVFINMYAATLDEEAALEATASAFAEFGAKIKHYSTLENVDCMLFKKVMAEAAKQKPAESDDVLAKLIKELTPEELTAWLLCRCSNLSCHDAAYLMNTASTQVELYVAAADEAAMRIFECDNWYDAVSVPRMRLKHIINSKDPWFTICFKIEQRFTVGRKIEIAILSLLVIVAGFFIVREIVYFAEVKALPIYVEKTDAFPVSADSNAADYWRRSAVKYNYHDRISDSLYSKLGGMADDTVVRVDFKFYDRAVMLNNSDEYGRNLEDVYIECFRQGQSAANLNMLIVIGIQEYFSNYELPWQPYERKEDFVSEYADLYSCLLELSAKKDSYGLDNYQKIIDEHPEVFATRESYYEYITSRHFIIEMASWLYDLVACQLKMESYMSDPSSLTTSEAEQLREDYEYAIFGYFVNGANDLLPLQNDLTEEQISDLKLYRYLLGEQLHEALLKEVEGFGFDALCDNLIFDSEIGCFSANLTKERILELAETDERFRFMGVSVSATPEGYPEGMEARLYDQLHSEYTLSTRYDIFMVDADYWANSLNYTVKLALPEAFIEDMFEAEPSMKNSLFAEQVGLHYDVRYGHYMEDASEAKILRLLVSKPDSFLVTSDNKYYTRPEMIQR